MGIFRRRGTRTRGDHVEDRTLTAANLPPAMLAPVAGGARVSPETALTIADAYACVRALADAAASLPLHTFRRRSDGGCERAEGRASELLRRPSPATTQANLVGQLVAHLNLHGNAYLGKFRDDDGQITQLALLEPARVAPEIKAGRPVYTVTGQKGERSVHGPEDIIHIRALSTDGLVGISPVRQCRVALGLCSQLAEHAARFFENDARPAGLLKLGEVGAPEQLEHVRQTWDVAHAGVRNAHRIAVVTGDVSFTPVSMPLEDAQFLEQRKLSATEVARIFRVPPWIIGADAGSSMTYANVEQQSLSFVTYALRPWLVLIEQSLSGDEDLFLPGHYCEFLIDGLLRADSATRAEVYQKALNPDTGWLSRDEVRRLENLAPESAPERTTHAS
jgi:HK97 family phage portal protein